MVRLCRRIRRLATRAAFAVATALALVPSADAQWFLPFGAAPPAEIVNRLRAEGYVLARPLERRDTVYLADVVRGPHGRERLVVDAWSGEILQRFLARRGGFAPEGGEFSEPPPLGPPPARDFREGDFGYGPPGVRGAAAEGQGEAEARRDGPEGRGAQAGAAVRATGRTAERRTRQSRSGSCGGRAGLASGRRRREPDRKRTSKAGGFASERRFRPESRRRACEGSSAEGRSRSASGARGGQAAAPATPAPATDKRRKESQRRSGQPAGMSRKRKGRPSGRPLELPMDRAYAALATGASIVLPEPIGIVRGFCASGTSRTRSMWSNPFSQVAPVATTWSASWKRRSNARAAIP